MMIGILLTVAMIKLNVEPQEDVAGMDNNNKFI